MQKTKKLSAVLLAMPTTLVGVLMLAYAVLHVLLAPAIATAATNNTVNFQARLMQSSGAIVPDGTYNVEFKLYDALTSSGSSQGSCTGDVDCLWTETRTSTNKITVVNGYLTANLGSVTAFPTTINWDQKLYLSMNIGGTGTATWDGEMSPRLQLTAVPYAFRAGQLATLNGSFTGSLSFVQPTANRSVLIPDESGTICLQSSTNCGFALSTGSGSYIQNGTSLQSSANFNISGTGTAATAFQTPLLDTSSAATLNIGTTNATAISLNKSTTITGGITQSGGAVSLTGNAASSVNTTVGALTLQSVNSSTAIILTGTAGTPSITVNAGSSGSISIGTTSISTATLGSAAATVNIATSTAAHTVHIADGGTGTQAVTVGSTSGASSSTTIQGGTGSTAINLTTGTNGKINLTAPGTGSVGATIGSGGFNIVSSTNSSTALAVQDASSSYIFSVSTSSGIVTMGAIQATFSGLDGTLNTPFGGLTLGSSSTAVTVAGSSSTTIQVTSGSFKTTVSFTAPTANRSIVVPDEAGTICLRSSTLCGFAASSGSANYIQNTTTAQSANMYVQAATSGSVAATLRANAAGTGDILDLKNGAGTNVATFGSTGSILLQNSTDSLSAFAINTSTGGTNENVFRVDTTNERVAVGAITDPIGAKLSVATSSTVGFRVYQGGSSDTIQAGNATADFFKITSTGAMLLQNTTNSTAAFQIQNAAGTSNLFFADTSNTRIAIAKATATYTLDVGGDINSTTQLRVAGNIVCDSTGCTAKSGSGFYVHNQTTVQAANMYIQAATSGTVTAVLQANAAGTGDILDLKNGAGTNVATFSSTGAATLTNSTNSTTAFQVQNAAAAALINVNTSSNIVSLNSGTGGAIYAWTATSSLSAASSLGASVVANGFAYVIGGFGSGYSTTVQYTAMKGDGTMGTWATTTALPAARGYVAGAAGAGFVYAIGGTDGSANQSTIYYAKQNQDGTLGAWQTSSVPLSTTLNAVSAAIVNNNLYVVGGTSGSPVTTVQYAHINGDGSINSFVGGTALPTALANAAMVSANGYLYYLGGYNGTASVSTTYYSVLNSDGSNGTWTSTTALPATASNFAAVVANGRVYIIRNSTTVSYATLNSDGTLGTWTSDSNALPVSYLGMTAVTYDGYIYVMGGYTGSVGTSAVYYTSGPRTLVSGTLDLVGLTAAGATTKDVQQGTGSAGGALVAGNTTVVGTLQVQGQSTFNQNVAINGNTLTVGNDDDATTGGTSVTVRSLGYAGINLYGDIGNSSGEPGGAYVMFSTDGNLGTEAVLGLVQSANVDPSGSTYTGAVGNDMLIGTRSNFGLQFGTNSTVQMVLTNGGNLCIGLTSCTHKLAVNGQIYSTNATITTGTPDVSETISAADDVGAMDVVMADPNNAERVIKTSTPYSSAALGVVSDGTSGFQIDHLHYGQTNDPNDTTYRVPLTLAGRVYVKVSNENGAIKPGDYLTSSSTAGYAMKAVKAGPTIGKALGYFNGDMGKVLVLVNVSYYDPGSDLQGSTGDFSSLNVSGDATINNLNVTTVEVSGDATIAGKLTVSTLTVGSITVSGHIITAGNTPTIQIQASAGQDATATVVGNDTSGVITILTGDQATAADLAKLTFATAYNTSPRVLITPIGKISAQAVGYVDQVDQNSFMLGAATVSVSQTYVFSYQVMQ